MQNDTQQNRTRGNRSYGNHDSPPIPPPLSLASTPSHLTSRSRPVGIVTSSSTMRSQSTLKSSSSGKSPRQIYGLIDRLIKKVYGPPTAVLTRRVTIRLHDIQLTKSNDYDSLSILEKMKQRMKKDENTRIGKLHEVYSRFVKMKNVNIKNQALILLASLMDTGWSKSSEQKQTIANTSLPTGSSGILTSQQLSLTPTSSQTNLDELEDSFKVAVGLSIPSSSPHSTISRTVENSAVTSPSFSTYVMDIPEQVLLRDLLYALQAIDSRYIYFDTMLDRFQVIESIGVSSPMRELIYTLCELGWFYRQIQSYITETQQNISFGVVGQSFCHVLQVELSEYFRLIAVLAAQVDADAENHPSTDVPTHDLTLRKLLVWTQDPLDRLRIMTRLIDSVQGLRGGALASGIYTHVCHGDRNVAAFVTHVMEQVTSPILRMIRKWVFEGELDDAHNEFFITESVDEIPSDQLWAKKYKLSHAMCPRFLSKELATKILLIGKSLNFIRECCNETDYWVFKNVKSIDSPKNSGSDSNDSRSHTEADLAHLEHMIETVSNQTNSHLVTTLTQKFKLMSHCRALKSYLLLGQGDFIQYLMDLLAPELSKQAAQIYRHTLTNVLETALQSSNAKFENPDILGRLDVELLRASSGDTGWDIFSLHYKLSPPLNTVIPEKAMVQYQRIFHFLWQLKRVEYSLAASWSKDTNLGHLIQGNVPSIKVVVHQCQLLRSEMIHFTTNLHHYMMFDVLETSWDTLQKTFANAKDIDAFIQAHKVYMASILEHAFLVEEYKDIRNQLKQLFQTIIQFCKTQEALYTAALRKVHEDKSRQMANDQRTARGLWGIFENDDVQANRKQLFGPESKIAAQIKSITINFRKQLTNLLEMMKQRDTSVSQNLPFVLFRFDFNEFYRQNDNQTQIPEP